MQDISSKGYYFLKATVQASYSQKKKYPCTLTISENSGTVKEGTCTCSAAGLDRCAHLAALLFAIDDFILELGNDVPTCTEKLCGWNKGRHQNKNPTRLCKKILVHEKGVEESPCFRRFIIEK